MGITTSEHNTPNNYNKNNNNNNYNNITKTKGPVSMDNTPNSNQTTPKSI
jgi:hypothetical protein